MSVTYLGSVVELLGILDRDGGYRKPVDQVTIAKARTLVAAGVAPTTVVVCNTPICPSRLELAGDVSPETADAIAVQMHWWTDGTNHLCMVCAGGGLFNGRKGC